uniref:Uncharacterized protein n=1 Tax=Ciona intestinalis TaxID=7719 RepID=H2XU45_CIOIN
NRLYINTNKVTVSTYSNGKTPNSSNTQNCTRYGLNNGLYIIILNISYYIKLYLVYKCRINKQFSCLGL